MTNLEIPFAPPVPVVTETAGLRGRARCRQGSRTSGITGCGRFAHIYDCPSNWKHAEIAAAACRGGELMAARSGHLADTGAGEACPRQLRRQQGT
jgi:hypothetical protein